MCLDTLDFKAPKRWDGMTVYKLAKRIGPARWAVRLGCITLGKKQQRAEPPVQIEDGPFSYTAGIHCCLTRDGARKYGRYRRRHFLLRDRMTILKGRITGSVTMKGSQGEVPVVVVTAAVWEKVVR